MLDKCFLKMLGIPFELHELIQKARLRILFWVLKAFHPKDQTEEAEQTLDNSHKIVHQFYKTYLKINKKTTVAPIMTEHVTCLCAKIQINFKLMIP